MKLGRMLVLAVLVSCTNISAQDLRIMVDKKGKVGFASQEGVEVIKCQYESAQPFKNGVAIVSKSGKMGFIDMQGNVLLPMKYTQISPWNETLYLVKDGKKNGLVDHSGKVILPVAYSLITKANCYGRALIAKGGKATSSDKKTYMANAKYGVIDDKGNILITPKYKGLYEFSFDGSKSNTYHEGRRLEFSYHYTTDTLITDCSYMGFSNFGFNIYKAGIMDCTGKEILKAGLYQFVMQPQGDMVRYYNVKKKETLCGYHNLADGKALQVARFDSHIDNINFWTHGDFTGDIAPVNGNSWSFVDKEGKVLRSGYSLLRHSQATGLWAAKNSSGKWDVFDEHNKDVSSLSGHGDILFPVHKDDVEIFAVQKDSKYGYTNRAGETVIPFEYDGALGNTFDMLIVKKGGKWGVITPDNHKLVPIEYTDVCLPGERNTKHVWVKGGDSLFYHFNIPAQRLSAAGYKAVGNFVDGIALVQPAGMNIADTPLNRALLYVPNTPKVTLDAAKVSEHCDAYGYLLNTDDVLLMDIPVTTLYKDEVVKVIKRLGNRQLTESEKKAVLLYVTRENRSYDLKSKIAEDEWDY